MADPDKLNERIQSLPQELQDHILDYTVTIKPGLVTIDSDYKPPWQLQINRAIRAKIAKQYYTVSVFAFASNGQSHRLTVIKSLSQLAPSHQEMITHFLVDLTTLRMSECIDEFNHQGLADGLAGCIYGDLEDSVPFLNINRFRLVLDLTRGSGTPKRLVTGTVKSSM